MRYTTKREKQAEAVNAYRLRRLEEESARLPVGTVVSVDDTFGVWQTKTTSPPRLTDTGAIVVAVAGRRHAVRVTAVSVVGGSDG